MKILRALEKCNKYLGANVTEEQYEEVAKDIEQIRESEQTEELIKDKENHNLDVELMRELSGEDVLNYLNEKESNEFQRRIEEALNHYDHQKTNQLYKNAFKWAISLALPKLESSVKQLISEITLKDFGTASNYLNQLSTISKNTRERYIELSKIKSNINSYLLNRDLPF